MTKRVAAGSAGLALLLGGLSLPIVASAAPFVPTTPLPVAANEAPATSRASIAALSILTKSGFDEASLRATSGLSARASFAVAGAPFTLSGSANATVPRRALGSSPGVAFLVKLPDVSVGLGTGDPKHDATYALATVVGTRVRIWAFYSDLPPDAVLSKRMIAALAKAGAPLATFDPTFQPGPGVGPDRYLLK